MKLITLVILLLFLTACACKSQQSTDSSDNFLFNASDNIEKNSTPCLSIGKEGSFLVLKIVYEN